MFSRSPRCKKKRILTTTNEFIWFQSFFLSFLFTLLFFSSKELICPFQSSIWDQGNQSRGEKTKRSYEKRGRFACLFRIHKNIFLFLSASSLYIYMCIYIYIYSRQVLFFQSTLAFDQVEIFQNRERSSRARAKECEEKFSQAILETMSARMSEWVSEWVREWSMGAESCATCSRAF